MRAFNRHGLKIALAVALVLFGSAACASNGTSQTDQEPSESDTAQAPEQDAEPTPVSLVTAFLPSANQAQFYWALEQGYYEEAGLDVTITSSKGSALAVQQVSAGQFDIGQADVGTVVQAGADLRTFMSQTSKGTFGINLAKDAGGDTWEDLYGKTVLVSTGSPETYLLPAVFNKLGLDLSQVEVVNVAPNAKNANFLSMKAEATAGGLPASVSVLNKERPSNQLWFSDVLDTMDLGYFAQQSFIDENPEAVQAFVDATRRATEELLSDPELGHQAVDVVIDSNPDSGVDKQREAFYGAWDAYAEVMSAPSGEPLGWIDPDRMSETVEVLERFGDLKAAVEIDDLFTNEFVE